MYMKKEIKEAIKDARTEAGMTQKEVEDQLSLRRLTLRDYESGRLKLPAHIAIDLAALYNVSLDLLLGLEELTTPDNKVLSNFHSLFRGNGYEVMFVDPVLRAFLETHQDKAFEHSLFEILTLELSEKARRDIIVDIAKMLNSLAASDGVISPYEQSCIKYLLASFELQTKYRATAQAIKNEYIPTELTNGLERSEMKHFIIWLLFFFSTADGSMTYQELDYIERCAEALRVNKNNFLFIKETFTKEVGE